MYKKFRYCRFLKNLGIPKKMSLQKDCLAENNLTL